MGKYFGDKAFLKQMAMIAIPISLQSLIASSLGIVDQMMIGQLGTEVIAGVGFGGRIPFIFLMAMFGITSGTSIYASQYYGKGDTDSINKVVGTSLMLGSVATAVFLFLALAVPEWSVGLFTEDAGAVVEGVVYLRYVSLGFIPILLAQTYSAVLRSTHHVKLPLIAGMISFVLNTVLNYMLIFGHFGAPEMGIKGAALATGISRIVEMTVLLGAVYIKGYVGAVAPKDLLKFEPVFVKAFMLTSLPLLINEFMWSLGESVYTGIYGHMGTSEAAAKLS